MRYVFILIKFLFFLNILSIVMKLCAPPWQASCHVVNVDCQHPYLSITHHICDMASTAMSPSVAAGHSRPLGRTSSQHHAFRPNTIFDTPRPVFGHSKLIPPVSFVYQTHFRHLQPCSTKVCSPCSARVLKLKNRSQLALST